METEPIQWYISYGYTLRTLPPSKGAYFAYSEWSGASVRISRVSVMDNVFFICVKYIVNPFYNSVLMTSGRGILNMD